MLTQSMLTLNEEQMRVARHRTPGRPGFGVFENVGTDLTLLKEGNVRGRGSESESVVEIRDLC